MFLKQQTALRNISASSPICLVPSESSLRIRDFVSNTGKQGMPVQYFNNNYFLFQSSTYLTWGRGAVESTTENCNGEL